MPHPPRPRHYPVKPDVRAGLEALLLTAPTEQARANVEAFIERTGGMPAGPSEANRKRGAANKKEGDKAERLTWRWLRKLGFTVTKSEASVGAGDLVGYGPRGTWVCQCKSISTFTPGCANEALRELLGLASFDPVQVGPGVSRVAVVWMRGNDEAPLVVVRVTPQGQVKVSGEPAAEVAKEVTRMLEAWGWQG